MSFTLYGTQYNDIEPATNGISNQDQLQLASFYLSTDSDTKHSILLSLREIALPSNIFFKHILIYDTSDSILHELAYHQVLLHSKSLIQFIHNTSTRLKLIRLIIQYQRIITKYA